MLLLDPGYELFTSCGVLQLHRELHLLVAGHVQGVREVEVEEREGDPCAGRGALRAEVPAGDLENRNVDEVGRALGTFLAGGVFVLVVHVVADLERDVTLAVQETGLCAHQTRDPRFPPHPPRQD